MLDVEIKIPATLCLGNTWVPKHWISPSLIWSVLLVLCFWWSQPPEGVQHWTRPFLLFIWPLSRCDSQIRISGQQWQADDQIFLACSIWAWRQRQEVYMAALMYRRNYPFYLTKDSECAIMAVSLKAADGPWSTCLSSLKKSLGLKAECWYFFSNFVFGFSIVLYIVSTKKRYLKNMLSEWKSSIFIWFLHGGGSHYNLFYKVTIQSSHILPICVYS